MRYFVLLLLINLNFSSWRMKNKKCFCYRLHEIILTAINPHLKYWENKVKSIWIHLYICMYRFHVVYTISRFMLEINMKEKRNMSHNLFKIKFFLHELSIRIKDLSDVKNLLTHVYNIYIYMRIIIVYWASNISIVLESLSVMRNMGKFYELFYQFIHTC